jgi:hypothetical protein
MAKVVEAGQAWEMYSPRERRWLQMVVAKKDDHEIVLRYQGTLELLWIQPEELLNTERFRLVVD